MKNIQKFIVPTLFVCMFPGTSLARSPWLGDAGQLTSSFSYVSEAFTEKWEGHAKSPIARISQQTAFIDVAYGYTDTLWIDAQVGFTESQFSANPSRGDFEGFTDSKLGITMQLLDEFADDSPVTLSVRGGLIGRGTYQYSSAGNPHSPGDLANGAELSVSAGRFLSDYASAYTQLGYRWRSHRVPDEYFYKLGLGLYSQENVSFALNYSVTNSHDGLDIKGPGFNPNLFHRLKEEVEAVEASIQFSISESSSLSLGGAGVLDGRNTGDSNIWYVSYSTSCMH